MENRVRWSCRGRDPLLVGVPSDFTGSELGNVDVSGQTGGEVRQYVERTRTEVPDDVGKVHMPVNQGMSGDVRRAIFLQLGSLAPASRR